MIIRKDEAKSKKVGSMEISEYPINKRFSGARIRIDGHHGALKCLREDRIYHVLGGDGIFTINGDERHVSKDDMIYIPRQTTYDFRGSMTLLLICSPAFDPAHDVFLDQ